MSIIADLEQRIGQTIEACGRCGRYGVAGQPCPFCECRCGEPLVEVADPTDTHRSRPWLACARKPNQRGHFGNYGRFTGEGQWKPWAYGGSHQHNGSKRDEQGQPIASRQVCRACGERPALRWHDRMCGPCWDDLQDAQRVMGV